MKVISKSDYIDKEGHSSPTLTLKKDKSYVVMAIRYEKGKQKEFYIIDEEGDQGYPIPYSVDLFYETKATIPDGWEFSKKSGLIKKVQYLSFPEWVHGKMFYENLSDGSEYEKSIYEKYVKLYA